MSYPITDGERWSITIICALSCAIIFVNPPLAIAAIQLMVTPDIFFTAGPWYMPFPLLALVALVFLYSTYHRFKRGVRIMVWALSGVYWVGWCVYFARELSPFIEHWIIWGPHVVSVALSGAGLYFLLWPNNSLNKDAH